MHAIGEYMGSQRTLEGDVCLMFAVDDSTDLTTLEKLVDQKVVIDAKKYNAKRSLNANAYFWKLCDLIAKRLGSDKDTIYLMMLKDHGVFEQIDVIEQAVNIIKPLYRYIEEDHRYKSYRQCADADDEEITMIALNCYRGSHEYDSKQMADLIDGTVSCAKDLGVETWTQEEIDNLIKNWESR